jgi:hypothetical protein
MSFQRRVYIRLAIIACGEIPRTTLDYTAEESSEDRAGHAL